MQRPSRKGQRCHTWILTYLIQDEFGQIIEPYSISAGLDYPGIGPEHAYLHASGRVQYVSATDQEALDALKLLTEKKESCQRSNLHML